MHVPNGDELKDKRVELLEVVKVQMKATAFQLLADLTLAHQDYLGPKMEILEELLHPHQTARVP